MFRVNQGFLDWNIQGLRQSIIFFIELNKVLEVANFIIFGKF